MRTNKTELEIALYAFFIGRAIVRIGFFSIILFLVFHFLVKYW